jgi:hypothetical protein
MSERADRLQTRPSPPDRMDSRGAAIAPNAVSDDDAMPAFPGAERRIPAMVATGIAPRLPPGADPDAVRDWFEFETIVSLPAPALSFAAAAAAAATYRRAARADNTRRAYRRRRSLYRLVCRAGADRIAGSTRDRRRLSRRGGGPGPRGQHLAIAPRRLALSASVGRLSAADRVPDGQRHLCRHPPRSSPAVAQKDRPGA